MKNIRWSSPFYVLILLLVFGLASLFYPFGRDQGIHAQVGGAWLAGELPYRDVWHPKGFLSFVPHALVTAVFGHTMWGIRLFDLVWQFGNGLLIFLLGRRRMGERGALIAVGVYYLVYYAFGYWHLAQPEGFLVLFVLLAVWLYERAKGVSRPFWWLFGSGFTIALTPWFKQTAVVFIVALFVLAAYDFWRTGERWKRFGSMLAGLLSATTLIVGFAIISGMFGPMMEAFRYILFEYPQRNSTSLMELGQLLIGWGVWFPALIFPFLAGFGYIITNRSQWAEWVGIGLLALAGLASVFIQGQLWFYHWVSSLPFMVLIGAYAIENSLAYLKALPGKRERGVVWLFVFICLGLVLPPLSRHLDYDFTAVSYLSGRLSREDYLAGFEVEDVMAVADYVREHTAEDTPIFVWGHYAMIYYLAERPNPTRFNVDPPLILSHSQIGEWQQETISDLAVTPPAYVIVATADTTPFESQTSKEQLPAFPALADFLTARYQLETIIGSFELYRMVE